MNRYRRAGSRSCHGGGRTRNRRARALKGLMPPCWKKQQAGDHCQQPNRSCNGNSAKRPQAEIDADSRRTLSPDAEETVESGSEVTRPSLRRRLFIPSKAKVSSVTSSHVPEADDVGLNMRLSWNTYGADHLNGLEDESTIEPAQPALEIE